MENVLSYAFRVLMVFIFVYFGTRVLTKKAIAQMTAYEMSGIIVLTTIAAEPLVTKVLTKALFGTGLFIVLVLITARLALVDKFTPVLEHTPSIVIKNGRVDMEALRECQLTLNELIGLMRQKGYDKISDVEYAVLEPQGQLSVFPKAMNRPVQPKDINVYPQPEGLTLPLIMDGTIIRENLKHANLTEEWLMSQLKAQGVTDYKRQVSLVELDASGNVLISKTK